MTENLVLHDQYYFIYLFFSRSIIAQTEEQFFSQKEQ